LASEKEKMNLYRVLFEHFTKVHCPDWYVYFTDSTYFEISNYLLDLFCIDVDYYYNALDMYEFIYGIQKYIWDECRKIMDVVDNEVENDSSDLKVVRVSKAVRFLEDKLLDSEGNYSTLEFLSIIGYSSIRDFIDDFKKSMCE
jgi:hypothetical protein